MAQEILASISFIIVIASVLTIIARTIKQPPIIAYILTGIIAGPLFLNLIGSSSEVIGIFAHIGVAFLLFIVGLSLDLRVLKEVGKVSVFAGFAEVIIAGAVGFLIAIGLGMSNLTSVYIGVALAFSSTVVVVKILSDKKEIDTLHGKIALGILIVQDFVAAVALMVIPMLNNSKGMLPILSSFGIAILLIFAVLLISGLIFNRFLNYLARSSEALFLFGIAWALILATTFDRLGFSLEIGALIAGISLASSKYTLELGGKMKPLRDFFVVLFFVFLGSQLSGVITFNLIQMAAIFSLFVLIGKPIIVMSILRASGYKKRTNFLTGTSLAQISEFSLILVLLGFSLGHLTQEIMSLIVLISIITIAISSYSIHYSSFIFKKISRLLVLFEGKKFRKEMSGKESFDVILFGYHRIGYKILKSLKKMKASFVVIDYNPKVILALGKEGINCIYGDAADNEFLSEINLEKAKLVISTIPESNSNLTIREKLKEIKSNAIFVATAEHSKDALDLYSLGADFVIVPQHLGGNYAASMIENNFLNKKKYQEEGKKHFKEIIDGKKNSVY